MLEMLLKDAEVEKYIKEKKIKYFKAEEFRCKHCGKILIHNSLIDILEELRENLKKPVIITSAYRCPVHNRRIGGVNNSAHVKGYAVDVKANSKTRYEILRFLFAKGITRIGIASNFIHFDVDPKKPQNVVWLYGKKRHVA